MHKHSIFKNESVNEKQTLIANVKKALEKEGVIEKGHEKMIAGAQGAVAVIRQQLAKENPNFSREKIDKIVEKTRAEVLKAHLEEFDKEIDEMVKNRVLQALSSSTPPSTK